MNDPHALEATIAALQAQRAALGDRAIDEAIDALRRHAFVDGAPAPAPQRGQRLQQLSVLFVDVAESTRLLSQIGADEADELLGEPLRQFAAIVQAHGGQVLRYTGDGLKAAFGAQALREDEAVHAVRAGLRILQAAEAHAARVQQQLRIAGFGVRVGIHTGTVLMGGGAEAERSAMGHAVHLAARMEQSAPVGRLRVSQDTWAQVRGLFRAEPQPPLWVKGHPEALLTHLVLGIEDNPERAVQRGIDGLATPMIGRDAELRQLLDAHAKAAEGGRLQAMTVLAEAGVGKTRLRHEWLRRIFPTPDANGLLQARANPDSHLQPYGLLRQLLARWLSIADDLDAASARERWVDGLAPWLLASALASAPTPARADAPAPTPRPTTAPSSLAHAIDRAALIGHLTGLDFSDREAVQVLGPRELREQGFAALIDVLQALARHASPLVLVLDDLHWADDASLDFFQQLLMHVDTPMVVLMLSRPSLLERRALPAMKDEAEARTLRLSPLDAAQGEALADALLQHLPDAPDALRQLVVERGEGHPFYMEELVRMLIDDGVIDARQRPWTMRAGWQQTARIPGTLVGVLQARLQALPADELAALQQASIVGALFWDAALAAVSPDAPAALPALHRRSLITARDSSAFADTRERSFHHQLLHDVTYATVLKPSRREGHARAAAWLAEHLADRAGEFLGITAAHFEAAGDSAQALEYYDRARIDAHRRFAHSAALEYGDRALRQPALTAPMWRYQLLSYRQINLANLGRTEEAEAMQAEMAAYAEACDNNAMRADVLCTRMFEADQKGRAAESEALAHDVLAIAHAPEASASAALAHGQLGWLLQMRQSFELAQSHIDQGIARARQATTLTAREGGAENFEQQLQVVALEILLQQFRWFDARAAVTKTLAALPPHRRRERLSLLICRSSAEGELGELEAARQTSEEVLSLAISIDIDRLRASALVCVAAAAALRGDRETQERAAREAEAMSRLADLAENRAYAQSLLADVDAQRGDMATARERWTASAQGFDGQGMPVRVREARARLADLSRREGQLDQALASVLALLDDSRGAAAPVAEVSSTPRDPWPLLSPEALVRCHAILLEAVSSADAGTTTSVNVSTSVSTTGRTNIGTNTGEFDALLRLQLDAVGSVLQRRLNFQLDSLPDDAARQRLVGHVPHWRDAVRQLG